MSGIKRMVIDLPADLKEKVNERVGYLRKKKRLNTTKDYIMALIKHDLHNKIIFLEK
ncbi:hypothetical protein KAR91_82980 [Candidatus Pacearchaeota archaeon]|nr:hypothetical protein [Candidatus Pacearchaeota archaeon]